MEMAHQRPRSALLALEFALRLGHGPRHYRVELMSDYISAGRVVADPSYRAHRVSPRLDERRYLPQRAELLRRDFAARALARGTTVLLAFLFSRPGSPRLA